jgi:signal transduction histidine kinase
MKPNAAPIGVERVERVGPPAQHDEEIGSASERAYSHHQSERELRSRHQFMAMLAHELRTPLNAILGYVRMLRAGQLAPEDHDRAFQVIEQSALAQAGLIADLMEAARMGEGKVVLRRAPVDLALLVEREVFAVRPMAMSRGVSLGLEVSGGPHVVEGDGPRLSQAVSNLLSNSIQFTPREGSVRVSVLTGELDVLVRVSDTGAGIAPHALPRVFERFWQADEPHAKARGGLGLGLSIVRDVVELHGGSVRAESPGSGKGATFVVTLPLPPKAPSSAAFEGHSGIRPAVHRGGLESSDGIGSAAPRRG